MSTQSVHDPVRIDTRGLKCPWPVLRAARAIREFSSFILLADDRLALTDVPALARTHGWSVQIVDEDTQFIFIMSAENQGAR